MKHKIEYVYLILFYFIFVYMLVSFVEWNAHFYVMHHNGIVKYIHENIGQITKNHIQHHLDTRLDQSLPDDFREEGLVFNILKPEIALIVGALLFGSYLFWSRFPNCKRLFSLSFVLGLTLVISYMYLYCWNSIHTHYHKYYVDANKPLHSNPDVIIYSLFPHFVPYDTSCIYKYLLWYHTLHHLTKGEDKCNYNIICPLFDFVFGTYKSTVDNTNHFSKHAPTTNREEWLMHHAAFDLRVSDGNVLEYRDKGTEEWKRVPAL